MNDHERATAPCRGQSIGQKYHWRVRPGAARKSRTAPWTREWRHDSKIFGERHDVGRGPVRVRRASVLRSGVGAAVVSTVG
jgi:hypothetical protein